MTDYRTGVDADLFEPAPKPIKDAETGDLFAAKSDDGTALDSVSPVFLHAGDDRVWCVGCTRWCPTEGYCEGDPDICPIGEEDQGRSPTLDEAQQAIDALQRELVELDDIAASKSATGNMWSDAATAPRDGSHILVTLLGKRSFGTCGGQEQDWCAVVHYWSNPGEEGFYLSSGNSDDAVTFSHWMPLPSVSAQSDSEERKGEE